MAGISLNIQGKEIPLPFSLLLKIAESCPDDAAGEELGNALFELGIPSISEGLVGKDFLSLEQQDALWESGDVDLRRALLGTEKFVSRLSDAQAREIIALDDVQMLENLGGWIEALDFEEDDDDEDDDDEGEAARLSAELAHMLVKHIRNHENVRVRAALAENWGAPANFMPPFSEYVRYVREGYDINPKSLKTITVEDVQAISQGSRDLLTELATYVEDIGDARARKAAVAMLSGHPDPEVRLALVRNLEAPRQAFKLLAKDDEPEISALARERLQDE